MDTSFFQQLEADPAFNPTGRRSGSPMLRDEDLIFSGYSFNRKKYERQTSLSELVQGKLNVSSKKPTWRQLSLSNVFTARARPVAQPGVRPGAAPVSSMAAARAAALRRQGGVGGGLGAGAEGSGGAAAALRAGRLGAAAKPHSMMEVRVPDQET